MQKFGVDTKLACGFWRVKEKKWRDFDASNNTEEISVFAECAGITVLKEKQREAVERLVDRLRSACATNAGVTNLTEHNINVQGAPPVKHRFRCMLPNMMEIA